jgi:hypothetical protein
MRTRVITGNFPLRLKVPYSSIEAFNLLAQVVHLIAQLRPLGPQLPDVVGALL